jgi:hypothetical protein
MADAVDATGIGKHPRRLVAPHRLVFPAAFPQLVQQLQIIIGTVVALVVFVLGEQAHGARAAVQIAGDDIPARAATGEVVQRGHAPGKQVGRFVTRLAVTPKPRCWVTAAMAGTSSKGR